MTKYLWFGSNMIRKGFTIVELLIVLAIITLLLGTASLSLASLQVGNRDARRMSDITLIAQAIDQYAFVNGGLYPKNARGGLDISMCASDLVNSTNSSNIDLSIFPKKEIPTDPKPANPAAGCVNMTGGYIYHTEYDRGGSNTNPAIAQKVTYTLEVGLEKSHGNEGALKDPSALNMSTAIYPVTQGGRYRYFLNGKYCGDTCYR